MPILCIKTTPYVLQLCIKPIICIKPTSYRIPYTPHCLYCYYCMLYVFDRFLKTPYEMYNIMY
jgi:hypothetical protein